MAITYADTYALDPYNGAFSLWIYHIAIYIDIIKELLNLYLFDENMAKKNLCS